MDKVQLFGKCVASAAAGRALSRDDAAVVREAAEAYPWFMTARLIYAEAVGAADIPVRLHHAVYGHRGLGLKEILPEELVVAAPPAPIAPPAPPAPPAPSAPSAPPAPPAPPAPRSEDLIEKFLGKGEYRIVPDDSTPDDDAAAQSADFDFADDLVSEELAQIYLAQGLNSRAKKIYERLSLLNPEKSIYFAEIIGRFGDEPSGQR